MRTKKPTDKIGSTQKKALYEQATRVARAMEEVAALPKVSGDYALRVANTEIRMWNFLGDLLDKADEGRLQRGTFNQVYPRVTALATSIEILAHDTRARTGLRWMPVDKTPHIMTRKGRKAFREYGIPFNSKEYATRPGAIRAAHWIDEY